MDVRPRETDVEAHGGERIGRGRRRDRASEPSWIVGIAGGSTPGVRILAKGEGSVDHEMTMEEGS